jgi:hypothetical protein
VGGVTTPAKFVSQFLSTPTAQRYQRTAPLSFQRRRDAAADMLGGAAQRIVVEVGISGGGRRLGVAKQLADDGEPKAASGTEARIGVSIMPNAALAA